MLKWTITRKSEDGTPIAWKGGGIIGRRDVAFAFWSEGYGGARVGGVQLVIKPAAGNGPQVILTASNLKPRRAWAMVRAWARSHGLTLPSMPRGGWGAKSV